MGKVVVLNHLTLDGVMQAPGRPDEDTRDGFTHGGWALPRGDSVAQALGDFGEVGGLLFGRRTYQDFFSFWPNQTNNPFTAMLDNAQKYVASATLAEPLPWRNSTLLKGDAAEAVAKLKRELDKNLLIMGSGELIRSLMRRSLVDEYALLIHPLVLGAGRRLFADGGPTAEFQLVDAKTTGTGVVIAHYRPAESAAPAS
jgi:dihydrofolate reductase